MSSDGDDDGGARRQRQPTLQAGPVVLAIDVGGSHVKILPSAGDEERRTESGPT